MYFFPFPPPSPLLYRIISLYILREELEVVASAAAWSFGRVFGFVDQWRQGGPVGGLGTSVLFFPSHYICSESHSLGKEKKQQLFRATGPSKSDGVEIHRAFC
jgi:hypothetical protein